MRDGKREWLVLRAQSGDRQAIEDLLLSVKRPLHGYLVNVMADRSLAEDVLQDVLFQVYRKLAWLRDPALFEPWVYRIASRAAVRRLTRTKRLMEEPIFDEPPEIEPLERDVALLDVLALHLEALSPASRAVITLHYGQDMTLQEVANVLEIPVGTAKSRLAYGLRCLRRAMEKKQ